MQEQAPTRRGVSPALLVFLIFPLVGMAAAVIVLLSNNTPQPVTVVTPPPVQLPSATQPRWTGEAAPDFELRTLEETTTSLSDYRGRVVFLNFWATWCVPCERELPTFEAFMAKQPEDGPVVVAVNIGETYDQVSAYLEERGIDGFPVLLDVYYEVADLYGIGPIPVTFVIDEDGVIRFSKYGEVTEEDLTAYIQELNL